MSNAQACHNIRVEIGKLEAVRNELLLMHRVPIEVVSKLFTEETRNQLAIDVRNLLCIACSKEIDFWHELLKTPEYEGTR